MNNEKNLKIKTADGIVVGRPKESLDMILNDLMRKRKDAATRRFHARREYKRNQRPVTILVEHRHTLVLVDKDLKDSTLVAGANENGAFSIKLNRDNGSIAIVNLPKLGNKYTPADITNAFRSAVEEEIAGQKRNGFPVARYDVMEKKAYLELADGTRDYVNGE